MSKRQMPLSGVSWPMIGEAGPTGTWRTRRPAIDAARCLAGRGGAARCQVCWMYCPEAVVTQGAPPEIDYRYCKGCGCCAAECPAKAIEMLPEETP